MVRTRADRLKNPSKSPDKIKKPISVSKKKSPKKKSPIKKTIKRKTTKRKTPVKKSPKKKVARKTTKKTSKKRTVAKKRCRAFKLDKCNTTTIDDVNPIARLMYSLQGTRFMNSMDFLEGLLLSKPRKHGIDYLYNQTPGNMIKLFITNDILFESDIGFDGDIIDQWRFVLQKSIDNTRMRNGNGETMFYINDYINDTDKIVQVISDVAFIRFVYQDLVHRPSCNSVRKATLDSLMVSDIITKKVISDIPIDILEVLKLFTIF